MRDLLNIFKGIKLDSVIKGTNKTLTTIKKIVPVYKEVRPFIRKEKSLLPLKSDIKEPINNIKKEYIDNDSLTFFH